MFGSLHTTRRMSAALRKYDAASFIFPSFSLDDAQAAIVSEYDSSFCMLEEGAVGLGVDC